MATKSTTRKSTAAGKRPRTGPRKRVLKPPAPKPAPEPAAPPPETGAAAAADGPAPVSNDKVMKRGDLLAAMAARSPMKKPDLRVAMELALDEIGKALDSGHDLVLPPLGKLAVKRRKANEKGDVLITRIKRQKPSG